MQAAAATFLVMSVLAGRQAKLDFINRNRATVFNTRFQAFVSPPVFSLVDQDPTESDFAVGIFQLDCSFSYPRGEIVCCKIHEFGNKECV